jgi:predicted RNA binding protein YcfA (HicA-like mRNA interferase family)
LRDFSKERLPWTSEATRILSAIEQGDPHAAEQLLPLVSDLCFSMTSDVGPAGGGGMMKVRAVIKLIEADGWFRVRTRGDHRQFHHPVKPGTVTVAGKLARDVPPGTLNSILRQAGLKGDGP